MKRLAGLDGRWWLIGLSIVFAGVLDVATVDAGEPKASRVLILTGEDYAGHKWQRTTPVLKGALSKDSRLTVDIEDDLTFLRTGDLSRYDAIVLHFKNYDPKVPGRAAFDRLDEFVRGGGGLVLVHFACGAFEEFQDDFLQIAGRVWIGLPAPQGRHQHDPYGPFTVKIASADHQITRGMQNFETADELYTCLKGDVPMTTLATAVSKRDGKTYPMAFVLSPGKGRVFHCVLGHDARALQVAGTAQLYRRGAAWAAGLDDR